jgi:hypothetical protein
MEDKGETRLHLREGQVTQPHAGESHHPPDPRAVSPPSAAAGAAAARGARAIAIDTVHRSCERARVRAALRRISVVAAADAAARGVGQQRPRPE